MADKIIKEIEIKSPSIREMKREIKNLKDEFAQATDPEQMQRLADEISNVENNLADTNVQLELMSHNGGALGQMNVQMSAIGKSIKQLDFDRANSQIKQLSQISFKGVISSLKNLGKTFLHLGKALLTNPFILLAAVVIGIVIALKTLSDRLGLTGKAFDKLGEAVEWVKTKIVELVGWFDNLMENKFVRIGLGILTVGMSEVYYAVGKATAEVIENERAYKKQIETQEKVNKGNDELIKSKQREIEILQAEGASIEDVRKEQLKLVELQETRAKQAVEQQELTLQATIDNFGAYSDEVKEAKKQLEQLKDAVDDASHSLDVALKADATAERENNEKKQAEWKALKEKRKAEQKKYDKDRLDAARKIEDLEIEAMEEGLEKERKINQIAFERKIEDIESNVNLEKDEKEKIIKQLAALQKAEDKRLIEEDKNARKQAEVDAVNEINEAVFNANATAEEKKIRQSEQTRDKTIEHYKKLYDDNLINLDQYNAGVQAAEAEHIELLKEITDEDPTLLSKTPKELEIEYETKLELYAQMLEDKLLTDEEYYERLKELNNNYNENISENEAASLKENMDNAASKLETVSSFVNAASDLMNTMFDNEINAAEGNEKKQEEIRKKQFAANKAVQMLTAGINIAAGIMTTLGTMGMPAAIPGMAATAALGTIQLATIAAKKYKGAGGGSTGGSSSTIIPSSSSGSQRSVPNINFTGTGTNRSEVVASPNINNNVDVQTQVVISEYEITSTQNKVKQLKDNATI